MKSLHRIHEFFASGERFGVVIDPNQVDGGHVVRGILRVVRRRCNVRRPPHLHIGRYALAGCSNRGPACFEVCSRTVIRPIGLVTGIPPPKKEEVICVRAAR